MNNFIRMSNDFELQLANNGSCEYPFNSESLVMKASGQNFHFRRVHGFGGCRHSKSYQYRPNLDQYT